MTQQNIKQLEIELWDAADDLRANSKLTAAEYKDPLLGLVLLRFAQNRFEDAKIEVEKKLPINPRTGKKREANKGDYAGEGAMFLPEKAKYDYLADLPEEANIAEAINNAMKLIEAEYPDLEGILPKNYQEFDDKLLRDLVRVFNKDAVKNAKGDVFGRIYEFFLMKFSMQGAGAQEGGEFFTPPSLVNLIVNFIQPNHGIVHDPACGSGGMFVQTAHFVEDHEHKKVNETIRVYGTELKSNNTRLAKMNLAIHGIEGKIIESNSFYTNPHNLTGKCDFVMANPPFNVDKIDAKNKFLADDDRLPFGPPLTGKGTISNGNYLWMQYFHSYLNATGRAGFVMASSATDAGNAEKLIRQKLIETGDVECIVAISNNFFYTRSLPCHVWFFNKGKKKENKDKVLMIDARNTFRKVSTTINDFSDEQLEGLTAIMNAFRTNETSLRGTKQSLQENDWLKTHFPKGKYQDVEGLCKIATIEEIKEQDYSLTPGRYVGVSIDIDMDFDYKTRMAEIHNELAKLNTEANSLMEQIQAVKL
ncbi:type I restriction-modification system subunit M [Algibacter luteus]|uniref:type I restriction-modification system subunit M n=1 Tax=Algibacter luteus TaxID=1178825 RepID=UPI0025923E18|nr:class I SAM-dependent DNA methyltransferase [Algibacter luteus]WJJ98232.1 class I SAM-dependent DNA methyltransferase [Algibacter luteus]